VSTAPRIEAAKSNTNSLQILNIFTSLNNQDVYTQLNALAVSSLENNSTSSNKSSNLLAGTNYTTLGDVDLLKSLNLCILDKVTSSALQQGLGTFTLAPLNTNLYFSSSIQKFL
jgi:hypothetical protein